MSTNHTRVLISFDLLFFSNSDFGSPFDRACFEGRLPVVRALLTIIDVNDREIVGSALHGASQEGHLEVVEALLAAGIDVNARRRRIWRICAAAGRKAFKNGFPGFWS